MARTARVNPIGVAQRIIKRGSHCHVCFAPEQDFDAYIDRIKILWTSFLLTIGKVCLALFR
jgi:hypothetical protein